MNFQEEINEHRNSIKLNIIKGFKETEDLLLEKGKKAMVGEVREWGGKKYVKLPNGDWESVDINNKLKQAKTALSQLKNNGQDNSDHAEALKNKIKRLESEQKEAIQSRKPKPRKPKKPSYDEIMDAKYNILDVEDELKNLKSERKQIDSDMNYEAGQNPDTWNDDDGNRYGEMLNDVDKRIEEKKIELKKLTEIYEDLNSRY